MKNKYLMIGAAVLTGTCAALAAEAGPGKLPAAATKTGVTFAADIQPIFEQSCVKCHGEERAKARLVLTSRAGVLKGSKEGPVLKAGNSAESLIVKAVAHATADADDFMPPLRNRAGIKALTAEQVGLIRAWIDQGAK